MAGSPHPAAEPGQAARARRGDHRGPAADHRRIRQPVPGACPGRALLMLVSEAVGATLADLGADTVFGVVGSGNFHVTNALVARGARFVAARHECGAACMADGWARLAGRPGIVSVHQGPGLTTSITGITEAAKSRTPMLVLAADVAAAAVRSNFRIDVASIATAVGATPERLHSAETAVADVTRAYRTAERERRTVVLALPLDVQAAECARPVLPGRESGQIVASVVGATAIAAGAPQAEVVSALAAALATARRPVFIAGRGARIAAARCLPHPPRPRACSGAAHGIST